jgi:hypothetical protein
VSYWNLTCLKSLIITKKTGVSQRILVYFEVQLSVINIMKWKTKKYLIVRTVPKSTSKIVATEEKIIIWVKVIRLWCLMPLSTIFQLYRGGQFFIDGGNQSTWRKVPPTCRKSLTNWEALSHNVVSSTPRQERDSNSQC